MGNTEGNTTFTITSNRSWTVEDDADWITVTPTSGSNDGTLTATYLENTNIIQRVGTITVTGSGITRTVTVTQESAPLLTVTPSDQYVGNTEGNTTFTITSNRSWTVEDDADWITVTPTSGSNDGTLTATYLENTNTIQRVGTITVTGGGITRTVTVTQESAPSLTVTPLDQSVAYTAGSTSFTITSNRSWTVEDDADWITVTPASGSNNGTLNRYVFREHEHNSESRNDNSNRWRNNQNSNSNTRISTIINSNTIKSICWKYRRQYNFYNNIK